MKREGDTKHTQSHGIQRMHKHTLRDTKFFFISVVYVDFSRCSLTTKEQKKTGGKDVTFLLWVCRVYFT